MNSLGLFYKGLDSCCEDSVFKTYPSPTGVPTSYNHWLGGRIPTYEFGDHTDIQSQQDTQVRLRNVLMKTGSTGREEVQGRPELQNHIEAKLGKLGKFCLKIKLVFFLLNLF